MVEMGKGITLHSHCLGSNPGKLLGGQGLLPSVPLAEDLAALYVEFTSEEFAR